MIYLAGPCDSEHRTIMAQIAKFLREEGAEVFCPWEYKVENAWDMPQEEWAKKVFDKDVAAITASEALIIISVGRTSSAGTNWEQGFAYAKNIPTHVIQITDEPTSLMTYCGSTSFINVPRYHGNLKGELRWILRNPHEENHNKCETVLT